MRCLSPRSVCFASDGKTISWSQKNYSKEYVPFQLPCGKCIECRLEYARSWAVRCVHESKMYEENSFVTLTYSDEYVTPKLDYSHFQTFMKDLRNQIFAEVTNRYFGEGYWGSLSPKEKKTHLVGQKEIYERHRIGFFATGEYGDRTKRPHWHALIFNWAPSDLTHKYTSERGDRVYRSANLDALWGKGITEVGSVTFESAGYVARYAAKKLIHGQDGTHEFDPISKKSSRQAIGKKWLEKYWRDVFAHGSVVLPNGQTCAIPRYYEKWLQKNHPDYWVQYVTKTKIEKLVLATLKAQDEKFKYIQQVESMPVGRRVTTPAEMRKICMDEKFNRLQTYLKKGF